MPANCDVAFVNSELRMLFLDYKFRDINKQELDEKEKITYLANAFELHSDHSMKTCANQINHDCITGDDLTYEIAVNRFTSVEICINTKRMNAQLAMTLSNQYNMQNDHHLANSLEHEERVTMIQYGRKRSRHVQQSRAEVIHERRRHEDPNPAPRMNQYGYDGRNRHQFGGNKIPIPDRYFNPQHQQTDQPRYPHMQSAPRPARSSPHFRFSSNRSYNNNNNNSFRQNNNTIHSPNNANRHNNNKNDPKVNVTFSPEAYTPHSGHDNTPHLGRSPLGRGRTDGRHGRGYGRSPSSGRGRANSNTQWTRDGQHMIEEPTVPDDPATTLDSTVPSLPDYDQPMVAVTTDEDMYLICDCGASRNNISLGSTEVDDFTTLAESLLTARIGVSLTVIGNGTIGLLGEVKVIPANELSKNIMSCGVMSRRGFAFFIRAYGMDCLIRFYLPDDDPEDLSAGYPLTTANLVTNNLYICLLEVFKQSMNQLTHKAKLYRDQR